jgi:hypothetical protein
VVLYLPSHLMTRRITLGPGLASTRHFSTSLSPMCRFLMSGVSIT